MIDKIPYTQGMREMLKLARAEAGRLGHDYIGPEHYLLGILRQGKGTAYQALLNLGIQEDELKLEFETRVSMSRKATVGLFSPNNDAKRVLEKSMQIAGELRHSWMGTEHLLLALMAHEQTHAHAVMRDMGLQYESLLNEVFRLIDLNFLASADSKSGDDSGANTGDEREPTIRTTIFPEPPYYRPEADASKIDKTPYTPDMFYVLELANAEALRQAHNYIGPEHLLLGILRQGAGIAYQALLNLEIKEDELKREIERRVSLGGKLTFGLIPLNKDARHVLEKPKQIAGELTHSWVGTEHLLLGLMAYEQTAAHAVMRDMGLRYEAVLKEVLRLIEMNYLASVNPSKPEDRAGSPAREESKQILRNTIFPEPPFQCREGGVSMIDKTPYTPGAREVQKLAKAEAGRLGHDYIGPEHFLLGIIRKGDGLANQTLINLEVDGEALREAIEKQLKTNPAAKLGLFKPNEDANIVLESA